MTWRTPLGERVLKGAEATLIREALAHVTDTVYDEIRLDVEPWEFDVVLFDRLEPLTKYALLAEVGWALLRDTDGCPILTAINESAIAVLFVGIEQSIEFEIDSQNSLKSPPSYFWRNCVLAVFQEDDPPEELPSPTCTDWDEWTIFMNVLYDQLLWDADFLDADQYLDAAPDKAEYMRSMMTIDDEYYRAIPPDPKPEDLPRIRDRIIELCQNP